MGCEKYKTNGESIYYTNIHQAGTGIDVFPWQQSAHGSQSPDGMDPPLPPTVAAASDDGVSKQVQALHSAWGKGNRGVSGGAVGGGKSEEWRVKSEEWRGSNVWYRMLSYGHGRKMSYLCSDKKEHEILEIYENFMSRRFKTTNWTNLTNDKISEISKIRGQKKENSLIRMSERENIYDHELNESYE